MDEEESRHALDDCIGGQGVSHAAGMNSAGAMFHEYRKPQKANQKLQDLRLPEVLEFLVRFSWAFGAHGVCTRGFYARRTKGPLRRGKPC